MRNNYSLKRVRLALIPGERRQGGCGDPHPNARIVNSGEIGEEGADQDDEHDARAVQCHYDAH